MQLTSDQPLQISLSLLPLQAVDAVIKTLHFPVNVTGTFTDIKGHIALTLLHVNREPFLRSGLDLDQRRSLQRKAGSAESLHLDACIFVTAPSNAEESMAVNEEVS